MGTFDNSISALKSKLSKIAEATRALSGSTKKLSLDEIPNIILQNTGTFCYYLGQGTSFNIKSLYPTQYMNFTVDNFIVDDGTYSVSCSATYGGSASTSGKLTKSYNKSTGVFTVGGTSISCGGSDVHNGVWSYGDGFSDRTFYVNGSASRSPKVWVVSSIRTAGEVNYCYYLGTFNSSGQINVKALYPNTYQNFNVNNFIVCASTLSGSGDGGYHFNSVTEGSSYSMGSSTPSLKYSNGILQISGLSISGSFNNGTPGPYGGARASLSNIKAYLVSSELQSSLIYLGTGTSFNVSSISGYQNFTTANFLVVTHSINGSSCDADEGRPYSHGEGGGTPAKISSYNSSTGQVTISPPTSYVGMSGYTDYSRNGSNSGGSWSVYLIVGSIKAL